MRVSLILAAVMLSACASHKLALMPPPGVDFSGRWKLNEADSDDPQRLVMSQLGGAAASGDGSQGGRGGQGGGRGGQGGGRGGRGSQDGRGGGPGAAGPGAPPLPAVGALSEGLRWPDKEVEIKQVAGVVAMTSAGQSRIFQPVADATRHHPHKVADSDAGPRDRNMRPRDRGTGPPPVCGWDERTLVVESGEPDEDHPPLEERFSIAGDGQRLIQVVSFTSSRAQGFTMSRVWDRSP